MSYMLSKIQYLGDSAGQWHPHLMIHVPTTAEASWGANRAGSPVLFDDEDRDVPEPETIFMIPGIAEVTGRMAAPRLSTRLSTDTSPFCSHWPRFQERLSGLYRQPVALFNRPEDGPVQLKPSNANL